MATAPITNRKTGKESSPGLRNGDRLSQREFHRRYETMPAKAKAELIGGVVYMPSPLGVDHADYHAELNVVLVTYKAFTPGVAVADNATTILGAESEPQPDLSLRILREMGGQTRLKHRKYLFGAPELIAEIAQSSRAIDLHAKKDDYERAGVLEYIVLSVDDQSLHWFRLKAGGEIRPNGRGIYRSEVFPGLWIDRRALLSRNTARLINAGHKGVASPEHAEFIRQLKARARKSR